MTEQVQQQKEDLSPAKILADAVVVIKDKGADLTVEQLLIHNLKSYGDQLDHNIKGLQEVRLINKATGVELRKLKLARLDSDRNGGGARTSKLMRKINTGRAILNQARLDIVDYRTVVIPRLSEYRNAILAALKLHYTNISQG